MAKRRYERGLLLGRTGPPQSRQPGPGEDCSVAGSVGAQVGQYLHPHAVHAGHSEADSAATPVGSVWPH